MVEIQAREPSLLRHTARVHARVAQSGRAAARHAEGRRFESCHVHETPLGSSRGQEPGPGVWRAMPGEAGVHLRRARRSAWSDGSAGHRGEAHLDVRPAHNREVEGSIPSAATMPLPSGGTAVSYSAWLGSTPGWGSNVV